MAFYKLILHDTWAKLYALQYTDYKKKGDKYLFNFLPKV